MVDQVLSRLGFKGIIQEIFGTEAGDLCGVLRSKIDGCQGMIQLVGHAYGWEPPVETEFGRVSYTQYEYLYAVSKGMKPWLIVVDGQCPRDTPIDQLDRHDPASEQKQRAELQANYRAARQSDGVLFHTVSSLDQLKLKLNELSKDLDALRAEEREWQAGVSKQLTKLTDQQAITKDKIRGHLLQSAERTHEKALAEADAAPGGWQQRQKLKDAAELEHAGRVSRIDDLAQSFAEIEGTGKATDVFTEMTRILAEEGVDEALAYVGTFRQSILEHVRTRQILAKQKNRDELRPLLKSAVLLADKGDADEARKLFEEILQLEPEWTNALKSYFDFEIARGDRALTHETLVAARRRFQVAESTARRLCLADPTNAEMQRNLSVSFNKLGDVSVESGDLAAAARVYFADGLTIAKQLAQADPTNAEMQRDLWVSFNKLGDVSVESGNLAAARVYFADGLTIAKQLAQADPTNAQMQRDLSVSFDRLGNVSVGGTWRQRGSISPTA